jgi:hypothetical protein
LVVIAIHSLPIIARSITRRKRPTGAAQRLHLALILPFMASFPTPAGIRF